MTRWVVVRGAPRDVSAGAGSGKAMSGAAKTNAPPREWVRHGKAKGTPRSLVYKLARVHCVTDQSTRADNL